MVKFSRIEFPTSVYRLEPDGILVFENQQSIIERVLNAANFSTPLSKLSVTKIEDKCMCRMVINVGNNLSIFGFLYFRGNLENSTW